MGFLESFVSLLGEGVSDPLKFAGTPHSLNFLEKLTTINHVTDFCCPPPHPAVSLKSASDILINDPRQLHNIEAAAP